jgi:Dyp-type peroxidase family
MPFISSGKAETWMRRLASGCGPSRAQPVSEYQDIQGILRSGYGSLEEASFLLLWITDKDKAKAWLAAIVEECGAKKSYRVTRAGDLDPPQRKELALQVAFTAPGLRTLGAPEELFQDESINNFPREFRLGMAAEDRDPEGRSRRLGDIEKNAPSNWEWGAPGRVPDVLVMLYAKTGGLAAFQQMVEEDLALGFKVRALETAKAAGDGQLRREPFGFGDGISQPEIDWKARREPGTCADLEYGNLIAPGEFLLGYQNEYGLYTQRPLLDPTRDPNDILALAEDHYHRDLGRNGTYLVLRQLEQDVSRFWRFVYGTKDGGVGLAEAMVGRKFSTGNPLVTPSRAEIRGVGPDVEDIRQNEFTYAADPDGLTCPFGAHIRRANPRTGDMPGGRQGFISWLLRTLGLKRGGPREDLLSSSRFHRIIRRGRPYGAVMDRESALRDEGPGVASGIYFIALNANISRQFEFIQDAWIANTKFNGLNGESDPLLGNRVASPGHPTDGFSLPQPGGRNRRIAGLPQFVTMRGGAYFFLPSIRALRFVARLD